MTKQIPVSKGKSFAIVDDADFEYLSQFKWQLIGLGYAARNISYKETGGRMKKMYMHIEIMGNRPEFSNIDHINQNRLDNRRENLRFSTFSQNVSNRTILPNNTSGYKGVSWHKLSKKWTVGIQVNHKQIKLGLYQCKIEAAKTYNEAALKYHGEFASLNKI